MEIFIKFDNKKTDNSKFEASVKLCGRKEEVVKIFDQIFDSISKRWHLEVVLTKILQSC